MTKGANENTPVITFAARSGTGKTTFLEKLIPELKAQGLTLAVIKHDAHRFEIDYPGKDTYRMSQAGADIVAISSGEKLALIEKRSQELELDAVIARLPKVDLILTEGYKQNSYPKIEIYRKAAGHEGLLCDESELLAVFTDQALQTSAPCYGLNDTASAVTLIMNYLNR